MLSSLLTVFTCEFLLGLGYGWVAPTLRSLQNAANNEISLNTVQCSWVASLHEFGRIFGPLLTSLLLDTIGRKSILAICTIIIFLSWLAIVFTRSVPVIYFSRLIFGVGIGLSDVTATIYMGENCHPQLRGTFGGITVACYFSGQLLEFILVAYLSYSTVAIVNTALAFFGLGSILVSTETVQFLITKGKYEQALKNFSWLKGDSQVSKETCEEFEKLRQHISDDCNRKLTLMALVTTPLYRKTTVIILALSMITMGSGLASINAFASITFTEGAFTPNEFTILFGALQLASVCVSVFLMEKLNRKTILISSLLVAAFAHTGTTVLFYVQTFASVPYFSWCIFSTITLYSMVYSMGMQPIFFTVRGELLPQNIKAIGGSLAIMVHSLVGFLTAKMFLLVAEDYGVYMNFAFFAVVSVIGIFFVYFIVPETRGRSLAEIQQMLKKSPE